MLKNTTLDILKEKLKMLNAEKQLKKFLNRDSNTLSATNWIPNDSICVILLIWRRDNDGAFAGLNDYYDDRSIASISAKAFERRLGAFDTWCCILQKREGCHKRINTLTHSMGSQVLQGAFEY